MFLYEPLASFVTFPEEFHKSLYNHDNKHKILFYHITFHPLRTLHWTHFLRVSRMTSLGLYQTRVIKLFVMVKLH